MNQPALICLSLSPLLQARASPGPAGGRGRGQSQRFIRDIFPFRAMHICIRTNLQKGDAKPELRASAPPQERVLGGGAWVGVWRGSPGGVTAWALALRFPELCLSYAPVFQSFPVLFVFSCLRFFFKNKNNFAISLSSAVFLPDSTSAPLPVSHLALISFLASVYSSLPSLSSHFFPPSVLSFPPLSIPPCPSLSPLNSSFSPIPLSPYSPPPLLTSSGSHVPPFLLPTPPGPSPIFLALHPPSPPSLLLQL